MLDRYWAARMRTLIIAAHPDDEVLGAGGWMAKYPGAQIGIVSEGTSAELSPISWNERLKTKRSETAKAAMLLKATIVAEGDFPDQALTLSKQLRDWIETVIQVVQPGIVLTHHPNDLNQDHRIVAEAVTIACRPYTPLGAEIALCLGFEVDPWPVPGNPEFSPGGVITLPLSENDLSQKLAGIDCYSPSGSILKWPHPRSIKACEYRARWIGARIGHTAGEAYHLIWGRFLG